MKQAKPLDFGNPINMTSAPVNTVEWHITLGSRMLGFLMDLMRFKFSDSDNIYKEELKTYVYSPDNDETRIRIMPGFEEPNTNDSANIYPAIIVNVPQMQVIEDLTGCTDYRMTVAMNNDGYYTGEGSFIGYGGTAEIVTKARGGLESLLLAEDIFLWLVMYNSQIQQDLHLSNFNIKLLSGPLKTENTDSVFVSKIQIAWATDIKWVVNPVQPSLSDGQLTQQ